MNEPKKVDYSKFILVINNYEKTPAFIGWIAMSTCEENELGKPPNPNWSNGRWVGYNLASGTRDHPTDIACDTELGKVIYGRIWYRDIFDKCRSSGFALRMTKTDLPGVSGHDEYWTDREESSLHPPGVRPEGEGQSVGQSVSA